MLLLRQQGGAGPTPSPRGLSRLVAAGPRRGRSLSRARIRTPAPGDVVRSHSVCRTGPGGDVGDEGGDAGGSPRAPPADEQGRCPSHPFVQLRRYSEKTGRWRVLLDGCPMCAIEASARAGGDGAGGAVRLRARSRSADARGGALETSYCPMADGGDEDPDGEERPPGGSSDAPEGGVGGESSSARASRSRSRPRASAAAAARAAGRLGGRSRSRSRAAARAVGRLLMQGLRAADPDETSGRGASPEGGKGGGAARRRRGSSPPNASAGRKGRHVRHDSDDARSSATLTTECSRGSSRLVSSDDDDDSVATEESADSSPEDGGREDFGESIVVSDLERQLYGAGTGYDVDDCEYLRLRACRMRALCRT